MDCLRDAVLSSLSRDVHSQVPLLVTSIASSTSVDVPPTASQTQPLKNVRQKSSEITTTEDSEESSGRESLKSPGWSSPLPGSLSSLPSSLPSPYSLFIPQISGCLPVVPCSAPSTSGMIMPLKKKTFSNTFPMYAPGEREINREKETSAIPVPKKIAKVTAPDDLGKNTDILPNVGVFFLNI